MNKIIQVEFRAAPGREDIETIVGEIAGLVADQRRMTTQMDAELAAVRARYEEPSAALAESLRKRTATVQEWAEAHPEEFERKRSVEFTHGTVGFRTNPPKLALLSRKWNWDAVVTAAKSRTWSAFIRTREEVDKDRILGLAANAADGRQFSDEVLKPVGLKIVREETFYVSPKVTTVEARQVAAA